MLLLLCVCERSTVTARVKNDQCATAAVLRNRAPQFLVARVKSDDCVAVYTLFMLGDNATTEARDVDKDDESPDDDDLFIVYDIDAKCMSTMSAPIGSIIPNVRTADGCCVWMREAHNGDDECCIFGSFSPNPDAIAIFYMTRKTTTDVTLLSRPPPIDVIKAMTVAFSCTPEAHRKRERKMIELSKSYATTLTKKQLEMDDLVKDVERTKKQKTEECEDMKERLSTMTVELNNAKESATRAQDTLNKLTITGTLASTTSSAIDAYKELISIVSTQYKSAIHGLPNYAATSYKFEWMDDSRRWVSNTEQSWVCHYELLHKSSNGTAPIKFQFRGIQYLAKHAPKEDPKKHGAKAIFEQVNVATSKVRLVRMIANKTNVTDKTRALGVLADTKFFCRIDDAQIQLWLKYDFSGSCFSSSDKALVDMVTDMATMFSLYSQYNFQYCSKNTVVLIKPKQMQSVLNGMSCNEENYVKLCCHYTNVVNLGQIETSEVGIDVRFGNSGCRFGKANYVAFTQDSGERNGYNKTGTPGKMVLCLIVSPNQLTTAANNPYNAYNFSCTELDANSHRFLDAVAIVNNPSLLPIAIVSP